MTSAEQINKQCALLGIVGEHRLLAYSETIYMKSQPGWRETMGDVKHWFKRFAALALGEQREWVKKAQDKLNEPR